MKIEIVRITTRTSIKIDSQENNLVVNVCSSREVIVLCTNMIKTSSTRYEICPTHVLVWIMQMIWWLYVNVVTSFTVLMYIGQVVI